MYIIYWLVNFHALLGLMCIYLRSIDFRYRKRIWKTKHGLKKSYCLSVWMKVRELIGIEHKCWILMKVDKETSSSVWEVGAWKGRSGGIKRACWDCVLAACVYAVYFTEIKAIRIDRAARYHQNLVELRIILPDKEEQRRYSLPHHQTMSVEYSNQDTTIQRATGKTTELLEKFESLPSTIAFTTDNNKTTNISFRRLKFLANRVLFFNSVPPPNDSTYSSIHSQS